MSSAPQPPWRLSVPNQNHRNPPSNYSRKRPADTQEAEWVAGEDRFVLQQAKKKAEIRVKEGRAKPIDWLAVTLRFIDPARNPFDDEIADSDLDVVDPEGVLEGLTEVQLEELAKDIDMYITLEKNTTNREFWEAMMVICSDRRQHMFGTAPQARGQSAVSADVDKLFSSKSYEQLETLEKQIKSKLKSNEPIDIEYWETLLKNLTSWKARAKLRRVSRSIVENQLQGLRLQQQEEAHKAKERVRTILAGGPEMGQDISQEESGGNFQLSSLALDPSPMLKLLPEDKNSEIQDEAKFLSNVVAERRKVLKLGFVPQNRQQGAVAAMLVGKSSEGHKIENNKTRHGHEDGLRATTALYEREVARGVGENEEVFTNEEEVVSNSKLQWSNKYRPRKPRYFNRVQMGYEWNKYNQTHYDHDNPPPKVVQGYKFNIFYPELIDKTKAPTYKIERENGRRRGQSFAPAGEEDTCLIRFIAGPPYEDIAFRIVDKEWDYSAKRERGFKSSFDKGILQLHFQFKKVFYRK